MRMIYLDLTHLLEPGKFSGFFIEDSDVFFTLGEQGSFIMKKENLLDRDSVIRICNHIISHERTEWIEDGYVFKLRIYNEQEEGEMNFKFVKENIKLFDNLDNPTGKNIVLKNINFVS